MAESTSASVVGDLGSLIGDFERSLAAANKSPRTLEIYGGAARRLEAFLVARGMPTVVERIGREHLEAFVADQLARHKPATASQRYRALAQLFKWLDEEGEIADNPFRRMHPPKVPEELVPVIREEHLRALVAACAPGRRRPDMSDAAWRAWQFTGDRDEALVRVLIDCGVRRGELMNLGLNDVDRELGVIYVLGKGRRPRAVPYGNKTAAALDRYLRRRARHRHAALAWLWLGPKGRLGESALTQILDRRAAMAGIPHLHPHQFRHSFAHQWMSEGLGESDLMQLAGWKSRAMLNRYGASAASERARQAHRRAALGDRI